ncbi:MarR family winged helix-turn-helix transcriptional regulator [Rhodoplanes sp. SY1]|uniref:MarR family winged helix-turn-helix transcriptional regulator n=1 Tax=Rhodoplanes sp. SY1 TaxID=3166646 RepID=UPI0038B65F6E
MRARTTKPAARDAAETRCADPAERTSIDFGPLDQRVGYVLRRAQLAVFQDFFSRFEALDIRPAQYSILTVIERNAGLSQTRIADALGIKKTNLVAMIDALEVRGLVRRAPTAHDRRAHALSLTAEGRVLMRKLHRISADHEQRIVARLGADIYAGLFAPLREIAAMMGDRDES